MNHLHEFKCVACRGGDPPLDDGQIAALLPQVPDWRIVEIDGVKRLERGFKFADFAMAVEFTDQVAALAESQDHHPRIITEWGQATIQWWTHKIRGLHHNDFVMAAKTDRLILGPKDTGKWRPFA